MGYLVLRWRSSCVDAPKRALGAPHSDRRRETMPAVASRPCKHRGRAGSCSTSACICAAVSTVRLEAPAGRSASAAELLWVALFRDRILSSERELPGV